MNRFALYDDVGNIVSVFYGTHSMAMLQGFNVVLIPDREEVSDLTHVVKNDAAGRPVLEMLATPKAGHVASDDMISSGPVE